MLTFLGSDISKCHWDNGNNITMIVENLDDNSIIPGMYLTINNNTNIYAQCPPSIGVSITKCTSPRSLSSLIQILPPLSTDLPVLSISAPAVLGDCQDYRYHKYYSHTYTCFNIIIIIIAWISLAVVVQGVANGVFSVLISQLQIPIVLISIVLITLFQRLTSTNLMLQYHTIILSWRTHTRSVFTCAHFY